MDYTFDNVFWIGGSPCSGKSTIASMLVQQHGFLYYSCDDAFWRHNEIVTPEEQPVFYRIMRSTPEYVWMRPVRQQVREEIQAYHEQFPLILNDLRTLPSDRPILAEGAALLPELIDSLPGAAERYIAVVPTPAFQVYHYSRRDFWQGVVKDTSDPNRAFQNWMRRDIGFARHVRRQASALGLRVLVVNGKNTLEENAEIVRKNLMGDRLVPLQAAPPPAG